MDDIITMSELKPGTLYSQRKGSADWFETFLLGGADSYNYRDFMFRIDDNVYFAPCPQFQEQLEKIMMWNKLHDVL